MSVHMNEFVTRLLHSSVDLPDSAWRAAAEMYGDKVFEFRYVTAPDAVVRERVADPAKLSATAAKSIARHTGAADVAAALASDRRVGVQTELTDHWAPTPAMVESLVAAKCSAEVAVKVADVAMPAEVRARLWTRMKPLDAVADAAREPFAVTSAHVAELLARSDMDDDAIVPYVVVLLEHHPHVADELIERAQPQVLRALACTRLGTQRARAVMDATSDKRSDNPLVWFALADHPGTELEIAQEAIARIEAAGSQLHRHTPVEPTAVPRIATASDWTDATARVALLRDDSPAAVQRRFHLREMYNATGLSDDVLRTVAFRIAGSLGYSRDYRSLFENVEQRLRADLGQRADAIFESRYPRRPSGPRTVGPLTDPVRIRTASRYGHQRGTDLLPASSISCNAPDPSQVPSIAVHLTAALGDDITAWRLGLEIQRGFAGTVEDLLALVATGR